MGETLTYAPRKVIKSQIMADFMAEWTDIQLPPPQIQAECWTMFFDGSVMKTGAGAGLLFISPLGDHIRYVIRLYFPASMLTFLSAPDLYTASARFRVAVPSEYSPKIYQSTEPKRQETIY